MEDASQKQNSEILLSESSSFSVKSEDITLVPKSYSLDSDSYNSINTITPGSSKSLYQNYSRLTIRTITTKSAEDIKLAKPEQFAGGVFQNMFSMYFCSCFWFCCKTFRIPMIRLGQSQSFDPLDEFEQCLCLICTTPFCIIQICCRCIDIHRKEDAATRHFENLDSELVVYNIPDNITPNSA